MSATVPSSSSSLEKLNMLTSSKASMFGSSTPNVVGTQSNGFACTKTSDNAGQSRKETEPVKSFILPPLWTVDPPFSHDPKSSHDDGFKPSINVAGTNEDNELPFDPNMLALEDVSIFNFSSDDEDDGTVADMNNLDTAIQIDEEVYLCQPPGFKDPNFPDRVYKVEKALYGLHEALRAWYETLLTYLLDNGFQRGKIDNTLFITRNKEVNAREVSDEFYGRTYILLGITKVKTVSTPIETQKPLLKNEDGKEVDVHMYRLMIGSLMYLTSSRPDIMFAVRVVEENKRMHEELKLRRRNN
nr:hypothetical protein [Tanacetum cinerariifolium]